ncbi:MAG TPA: hypothetical protein VFD20_06455 [Demequina sp.]|nr:hypothetical protein [Demequina sp.]
MTRTLERNSSRGIAVGVVAGTVTVAILAGIAWSAGHPDFARGVVLGGAIGIAGVVTLTTLARTFLAEVTARASLVREFQARCLRAPLWL